VGSNPTLSASDFASLPDKCVRSTSLNLLDDIGANDRAGIQRAALEEVLEADRLPEIVFERTQVEPTNIAPNFYRGNLTLLGDTNRRSITARVTVAGDTLCAKGEFSLKQTAYGIRLVSVAGGVIRVKDDLKLTFDSVARKQV
jgi:hypothetical protein